MKWDWTINDLNQLKELGISTSEAESQLLRLQNGFSSPNLLAPARISDGIKLLSTDEEKHLELLFEEKKNGLSICKFVPASGAASRMFVHLHSIGQDQYDDSAKEFMAHLRDFPFWPKLQQIAQGKNISNESHWSRLLLDVSGLGYGNLPKGLVDFHQYPEGSRTAFQEQIFELPFYAVHGRSAALHFTVAAEFIERIRIHLLNTIAEIEESADIEIHFELSTQNASTDTLAGTSEGKPFRDHNNRLVFRPGGHGALLKNLSNVQADIVFIKNIDNVVPDAAKEDVLRYKRVLAGHLLKLAEKIKSVSEALINDKENSISEALQLLQDELGYVVKRMPDKQEILQLLSRPLRVCGMVKNEGEPGGGPFWVQESSGNISLQIVEKAQIDLSSLKQAEILASSTHFNPVDIVAMPKGALGLAKDLTDYIDPEMGFMSAKTFEGRALLALEHPGLWNGSMANWNTVFVEVPLFTFNPVKTVNDLLRPIHRFAKVTF